MLYLHVIIFEIRAYAPIRNSHRYNTMKLNKRENELYTHITLKNEKL